jgi:hypothetical protein
LHARRPCAAEFVPCPPELGVRLLAPALAGSLQCDSVWSILRDTYESDPVNNAQPLLPDWVQWCARRTELNSELADRALSAARAEAATAASEHRVITEREAPFRRLE